MSAVRVVFHSYDYGSLWGGWGKQARRVWSELAKKHSLAIGELTSDTDSAIHMLQRLSIIFHRENARAILRRSSGAGG